MYKCSSNSRVHVIINEQINTEPNHHCNSIAHQYLTQRNILRIGIVIIDLSVSVVADEFVPSVSRCTSQVLNRPDPIFSQQEQHIAFQVEVSNPADNYSRRVIPCPLIEHSEVVGIEVGVFRLVLQPLYQAIEFLPDPWRFEVLRYWRLGALVDVARLGLLLRSVVVVLGGYPESVSITRRGTQDCINCLSGV